MHRIGILFAITTVFAGACADPETPLPAAPDQVWITVGADELDHLDQAMARGELYGVRHHAGASAYSDGEVALLQVPRDQVPELTRVMHESRHRCGGYVAHESLDSALVALDDKRARDTVRRTFVTYTIDNDEVLAELAPQLDQRNLLGIIDQMSNGFLNRYHTTTHGLAAANWLADTWGRYVDAAGRDDAWVELYQHTNTNQPSVILTIRGDTLPNEVVVVGGHLDSTLGWGTGENSRAPGADDDASGVATFTEVARVLLSHGFRPDRTVKFMAYAAEEVGLVGSNEIANDFLAQGIDVVGVLQLDMTNYNGSVPDIVLIDDHTNQAQNAFIGQLVDTYLGLQWAYSSCGYACSDHASWNSAGFPASIPFEALFGQYNPAIHTQGDTLANSDGDAYHAMKFADLALAYVVELAKGDFADDPLPMNDATVEEHVDSLADDEVHQYGPYIVAEDSIFDAHLAFDRDAELYVRFDAQPTTTQFDCHPEADGAERHCATRVPYGATEAYVMVRGSRSTYTLTLTYLDATPPPPPVSVTYNGSVSTGQYDHYGPFAVTPGTAFSAAMTGSGDGDLYVRFGAPPTQSQWDCRPYTGNTNETCVRPVPAGQSEAYVMIHGYSSATYTLTVTHVP